MICRFNATSIKIRIFDAVRGKKIRIFSRKFGIFIPTFSWRTKDPRIASALPFPLRIFTALSDKYDMALGQILNCVKHFEFKNNGGGCA